MEEPTEHTEDAEIAEGNGALRAAAREITATFAGARCSPGTMNTFLKILLAAVVLVIAIKFSPILFIGAFVGLVAAAVLGAVGLSLLAALVAVILAFALALSPIWIPVLCVVGLISLFKRNNATASTPPPVPASA